MAQKQAGRAARVNPKFKRPVKPKPRLKAIENPVDNHHRIASGGVLTIIQNIPRVNIKRAAESL